MNAAHYTYRVIWSAEDQEYVGLCAEFPGLSYLDVHHIAALEGVVGTVREVITEMAESGETIPVPLTHKPYSGKFQVRMPPEQHRLLAIRAAEEGVSLNRYVSSRLT